jgi:hypothetical protein
MLDIYDELLRPIEAFKGEVHYALCGGMALAVHGSPIDIDLLVLSESLDETLSLARDLDDIEKLQSGQSSE